MAPEKPAYAVNRYRREAERHYEVLDEHLKGRQYIVGEGYTPPGRVRLASIAPQPHGGWTWVSGRKPG